MMEYRQKILIVDDNLNNLHALRRMLAVTGAEVVEASNGNDALMASLNHDFALAILDVQMPDMDGYELAELLRSAEKTRRLPILLLSAVYSDEYHVFKGYDAGAVDFMIKPYHPRILLHKVNVFLQLDRQKTELLQKIELERSRNYLESILTSIGDAILVVSLDAVVKTVNQAAVSMLEYDESELAGMPLETLCRDKKYAEWVRSLGNGSKARASAKFENAETTLTTKRGHTIPVRVSCSELKNDTDAVMGAVFVARDVTERKLMEKELKAHQEHLEELVEERSSELKDANLQLQNEVTERRTAEVKLKQTLDELARSNAELDSFAYSVSHDLRAPLRSMDGFSNALLEDYYDKLDERAREYIGRVHAASQRMAQLIDDILGLSRVSRGEMQREPVDLSRLAHAIGLELRQRNPEREVEFVVEDGLMAEGDARLLRIALDNLLGNAWKFTGKCPSPRVEFGRAIVAGQPAFFVRDNGAGFDMQYADKLFGAFQRLHSSDEFEGTGIGLATIQRVIHRHGGRVWAEGKVGQGATFYFKL